MTSADGTVRTLKTTTDFAEPLPLWETGFVRSFVTLAEQKQPKAQGGTTGDTTVASSAPFYLGTEKVAELTVRPE